MNWLERLKLRNKLIFGFSVPLLLIVVIAFTVYASLNRLLSTSAWVTHTYQAIELGNSITGALVNMETGLRGYLVAGKESFLEPYDKGRRDFNSLIEEAKNKVSDNPQQVARLEKVEQLESEWQEEHVQVAIDYRKEVVAGANAAERFKELSKRIVGKEKFDGFRATVAKIDQFFRAQNDIEAQLLINLYLMDMINQETGQRGFLLTGKEESLEPYHWGIDQQQTHFTQLQSLIGQKYPNSKIRQEMIIANDMANEWRNLAANPEIEARREMNKVTTTISDVTAFIEQGIGKQYMDSMRTILDDFVAAEQALIKIRNDDFEDTAATANAVTIGGALLAILIGTLVTVVLTRAVLRQLGADPADIKDVADRIAGGDLSLRVNSEGSVGVQQSMAKMQEQLRQVIENELQHVVDSAKEGDLTKRIDLSDKSGFYRELSQSINALVTVNQQVVSDTGRVLASMARGNLNETITADYTGAFGKLKNDANETIEKLTQIIEGDIQVLVSEAKTGKLSGRIDLDGKEGFFKSLSQGINELLDINENVLNDVSRVMQGLARGDLKEKIDSNYTGLFETIKNNTNDSTAKLEEVVTKILAAASQVKTASNEIAAGNSDLSQRTEAQASSLEETAASMEELSQVVRQNAERAAEAASQANSAQHTAEQGGSVVNNAIEAMSEINQASRKITEIIGVIDEIAFQTNLLALNAAVEAARAGEQGRGFAVVASEVRTLAERSGNAAKEIKGLIKDSVNKVEDGTTLVNESGETLKQIVSSVTSVVDLIEQISVSAREQSIGINQVNSAISQMEGMTQQNAAMVEQASAASQAMSEQAWQMIELMNFFKVEKGSY